MGSYGQYGSGPSMYLNPQMGTVGMMKLQAEFDIKDVGTIIGKGGERVRRIKQETGVAVSVSAYEDGQQTRTADFTGAPKGIAAALHFIAVHIGLTRPDQGQSPLCITVRMDPREL